MEIANFCQRLQAFDPPPPSLTSVDIWGTTLSPFPVNVVYERPTQKFQQQIISFLKC